MKQMDRLRIPTILIHYIETTHKPYNLRKSPHHRQSSLAFHFKPTLVSLPTSLKPPVDSVSSCHRRFGYEASKQAGELFKWKCHKPILTSVLVCVFLVFSTNQSKLICKALTFSQQRSKHSKQQQSNRLLIIFGSGDSSKFFNHVSVLDRP